MAAARAAVMAAVKEVVATVAEEKAEAAKEVGMGVEVKEVVKVEVVTGASMEELMVVGTGVVEMVH